LEECINQSAANVTGRNSPGVMTVVHGNHDSSLVTPLCDRNRVKMLCYYLTLFQFHVFRFFLEKFSTSVLVCHHTLSCAQFTVFWLDRVSYRNYSSTLCGLVSIEALPVLRTIAVILLVSVVIL
jgi:hypothetical protein